MILPSTGIGFDTQAGDKDPRRFGWMKILVTQFGDRLFELPNFLHISSKLYQFPVADILEQHKAEKCEHGGFPLLGWSHFLPTDMRSPMMGCPYLPTSPPPYHLPPPTTRAYLWRNIARLFALDGKSPAVENYLGSFAACILLAVPDPRLSLGEYYIPVIRNSKCKNSAECWLEAEIFLSPYCRQLLVINCHDLR